MSPDGNSIAAPPPGIPPAPVVKTEPGLLIVTQAPVEKVPVTLSSLESAIQIEAKIARIRAAAQEIVLTTKYGDIVIKAETPIPLPPGTTVTVELTAGDPPELASIRLAPENIKVEIPELAFPQQTQGMPPEKNLPLPPPDLEIPAVRVENPKPKPVNIQQTITAPLPLDVEQAIATLKDFLLTGETAPAQKTPVVPLKIESFTPQFPPAAPAIQKTTALPVAPVLKIALALKEIIDSPTTSASVTGKPTSLLTAPPQLTTKTDQAPPDINIAELASARIHARIATTQIQTLPASLAPPVKNTIIGGFLNLISLPDETGENSSLPTPVKPPFTDALKIAQVKILSVLPAQPTEKQIHMALAALFENKNKTEEKHVLGVAKSLGRTPTGQILLETDKGHMILQTMAHAIPKGSIVITESMPVPQSLGAIPSFLPQTALFGISLPDFDPLTSHNWPALEEALKTISAHSAPAAQSLRNALPSPTPRLVPTALFFLAALKGGIIENWIGDKNISLLKETGHQKLAERLASDFGKMAGQAGETLPSDWKAISMPILHDDQISKMMFFVRHQNPDDKNGAEGGKKRQTRFILNISLSKIGDMQIDGLFRQGRLDVALRTRNTLTKDMQNDLTQKYAAAMEQTQLAGKILFQTKGWVEPPPATKAASIIA